MRRCFKQLAFRSASLVALLLAPVAAGAAESDAFVVRDLTNRLSGERVAFLTSDAQEKLDKVLRFYGTGSRIENLGRIRLEFDEPRGGTYATVFIMLNEGDRRVRVVRVYGVDRAPQMVAHKLTHAIFVSSDKLVRNMMGIPMEVRFGNPLTFPMCGFGNDEWVAALRRLNAYMPLSDLGPDHEQWGMTTRGGVPVALDRARQHVMYAESGSFGEFLLNTYGTQKIKQFYRLSEGSKRPWQEAFGTPLKGLEDQWLQSIESTRKPDEKKVELLASLLKRDAKNACSEAQRLAEKSPAR